MHDIIIIGGGVSGFAAAIYAGRFRMSTLVLTGDFKGGLITWAKEVQNYPGFKSISGMDLAKSIEDQAMEYDIDVRRDTVVGISKLNDGSFEVATRKGKFSSRTVLFATGTKVRNLGVDGESKYKNCGVHYCALCDGYFYKGKVVAVIGGSDSAAIDALMLKDLAEKVYVIYRKDKLRSEPVNTDRVLKSPNVEVIYNTNVTGFIGDRMLESVRLDRPHRGSSVLDVDGVFVSIGHVPQTELLGGLGVRLDQNGFVEVDRNSCTNVPGFFAAGDVTNTEFKQAITGVAQAVMAVYWAHNYVDKSKKENF